MAAERLQPCGDVLHLGTVSVSSGERVLQIVDGRLHVAGRSIDITLAGSVGHLEQPVATLLHCLDGCLDVPGGFFGDDLRRLSDACLDFADWHGPPRS